MSKILSRKDLKAEIETLRRQGKRVVFTNGCFDILHVGHVRYLREAKKEGDILVVALNSDRSVRAIKGEKRPIVPETERADVMSALESVDYVTIFDEPTPLEVIRILRPDILVKGGDWEEGKIVGRDTVCGWGGRVAVIPEVKGASTTNLVEKIRAVYNDK
ncbi:MAG: D-glycero-beta-D-manno-heptose 1-phosphate adenylyltransferase [Syntrophales bacterium]|jgi:D-beta-D-heptose 7-phosphate kinase/D-beta-D-heptose 1-phosphate adenosyltransferase|nr:D-glycero-beta-D-manno-heptose 1-phosphate adenylyltransferase [Syntrophales bacterium]